METLQHTYLFLMASGTNDDSNEGDFGCKDVCDMMETSIKALPDYASASQRKAHRKTRKETAMLYSHSSKR